MSGLKGTVKNTIMGRTNGHIIVVQPNSLTTWAYGRTTGKCIRGHHGLRGYTIWNIYIYMYRYIHIIFIYIERGGYWVPWFEGVCNPVMDPDRVVNTLATPVGGRGYPWYFGTRGSKLAINTWSNSFIQFCQLHCYQCTETCHDVPRYTANDNIYIYDMISWKTCFDMKHFRV